MSFDRDKFRALCAAIYAFQREMGDADMKSSIVINLDLRDFQGVMHSADQMFGYTLMPDGSVKIMDAIVRPRRLEELDRLRASPAPEPIAWRYRNSLGEIVSEWIDGTPPATLMDVDTCEQVAVADMNVELAYASPAPDRVSVKPLEVTDEMGRALVACWREECPGGGWPALDFAKDLLRAALSEASK